MKNIQKIDYKYSDEIAEKINLAWNRIAPFWPLKNLIACNPLQGFEDLPFDEALKQGFAHFKHNNMPQELENANLHTIKWCQVYFDEGQSTIKIPKHEEGFFKAIRHLAVFDGDLHQYIKEKTGFLFGINSDAKIAIEQCLEYLKIAEDEQENFLTLALTSLPGWASYMKYLGKWSNDDFYKNILEEYLAVRLMIICVCVKNAETILNWHNENLQKTDVNNLINQIKNSENNFLENLLEKIKKNKNLEEKKQYDAQMIFCIDVRSEPIRRAIEKSGNYQTFGFAGFFGIPVAITNEVSNSSYASCPVLLKPKHNVKEKSNNNHKQEVATYQKINYFKNFYQALKYNFTTPIALAEAAGIFSATYMTARSVAPKFLNSIKNKSLNVDVNNFSKVHDLSEISFEEKVAYASGMFKTIGFTDNFAEIVVLCGHGSATQNNSYETALDCGACGGRHGGSNAKIMAMILNDFEIRGALRSEGIYIPDKTIFVAALHNTTSDEIVIFSESKNETLKKLKENLKLAREENNYERAVKMGYNGKKENVKNFIEDKTHNWSETRPEWGLAGNAAFIVAPREVTKNINLNGRCFLHSYDYKQDENLSALELILAAPMVVAQWINSQYLFSTIDNVAFGSGSKITHNITGKIAIMQGNGSDLMHGLPLQSVYANDQKNFHEALRLTTLIYAPNEMITTAINKNSKVKSLFTNGWLNLISLDPNSGKLYRLDRNIEFSEIM